MKKRRLMFTLLLLCFAISLLFVADRSDATGKIVVSDGKLVKAHYTLTVDGKVVDSSKGKEPLQFKVGSKQMIPGFEKAIIGMKVGEKKSFKVSPKDGYGIEDPKAFQNVPKNRLPHEMTPKAGMLLRVKGKDGREFTARISEVRKDMVVLNFNHPLAGKTLNFDVEIVEVK